MIALIRPIVTIVAVLGISTGFFMGKINGDAYLGIMAVAITYWYKARDEAKNGVK